MSLHRDQLDIPYVHLGALRYLDNHLGDIPCKTTLLTIDNLKHRNSQEMRFCVYPRSTHYVETHKLELRTGSVMMTRVGKRSALL